MPASFPWSIGLAFVVAAFAGCMAGDPDTPRDPPASTPDFDDTTGAIQGLVTTAELQPLEGAAVALRGNETHAVPTSSSGQFVLSRVAPGDHVLFVTAIGYASQAKSLTVVAGQVASIQFRLDAVSPVTAYSVKDIRNGFISCGTGAGAQGVGGLTQVSCGAQDPNQKFLFSYTFTEGLRGVLFEMVWKPSQVLSRDLALIVEKDDCDFACESADTYMEIQGCCYLRAALPVENLTKPAGALAATDFRESSGVIQTRTFPAFGEAGNPATVFTSQEFMIYVEYFYNELPADFGERTNVPPG